jgi:hypothetical protein
MNGELSGTCIESETMHILGEGYTLEKDGFMRCNKWIDVLPNDNLRNLILRKAHRAVYMAHPGVTKMRENLSPYSS